MLMLIMFYHINCLSH